MFHDHLCCSEGNYLENRQKTNQLVIIATFLHLEVTVNVLFQKLFSFRFQIKSWLSAGNKLEGDKGVKVALKGRNFALNGTQGEAGVSLKNCFRFVFHNFHSVTTKTQAVATIYYHCI